jgi:cardiolipin synthase
MPAGIHGQFHCSQNGVAGPGLGGIEQETDGRVRRGEQRGRSQQQDGEQDTQHRHAGNLSRVEGKSKAIHEAEIRDSLTVFCFACPLTGLRQTRGMDSDFRWLRTGQEAYERMLAAIHAAESSVRLETYIFHDDAVGRRALEELVNARKRGIAARVLVDSVGSLELRDAFWKPLRDAGGEVRWFNPIRLRRFSFRDHRKIFVCDERIAFIGGFNIGEEYADDGVTSGWRDLGMEITGPLASELARAMDAMFDIADERHRPLAQFRRVARKAVPVGENAQLILTTPGFGKSPFKTALHADLAVARDVRIINAYFLPTARIRRELGQVVKRGGRVQLLLPGKSDIPLMQRASRSLYRRLMKSGIGIAEYQPQILHTKMIVLDDVVYAGSLNLDTRSLHINYEVMLRVQDKRLADEGRAIFEADMAHARVFNLESWKKSRTWWDRFRSRFAYFILFRLDRLVASLQLQRDA